MSEEENLRSRNQKISRFLKTRRELFTPLIRQPSPSPSSSSSTEYSPTQLFAGEDSEREARQMAAQQNNQRSLRELSAPTTEQQPLCITFPPLEGGFELKSNMIHWLPKFHGVSGEDPNKHLTTFELVCSSMRTGDVPVDQVYLRAFFFSLEGAARDWLYYQPSSSITSWSQLKSMFLEKYFPASKSAILRREICSAKQLPGETLYEYWERFWRLVASCPNHQISEELLIQYFYEGLSYADRTMIDAASGGALVEKTPAAAKQLIDTMAKNSRQFGIRSDQGPMRRVNEIDSSSLEKQISNLTLAVQQLVSFNTQNIKPCGICSIVGHSTDMCPQLQEDYSEQCNALGGFQGQQQRRFDPPLGNYTPEWRNHPNLAYGNQQTPTPFFNKASGFPPRPQQQGIHQQSKPQQQSSSSGTSLEEMMKALVSNSMQFQQDTKASILNLENQIGQLAATVSDLKQQNSGKLPSQPLQNPKGNVSAITLRSGKELKPLPYNNKATFVEPDEEEEAVVQPPKKMAPHQNKPSPANTYVEPAPFPGRFAKAKKEEQEKEILETFRKVELNIPLLEAIKQVPRYAKFLKELCTFKRKMKGKDKQVILGENVSAVFQKKLPPKCKDPGSFNVPCTIGDRRFNKCMTDLGSSINVMPLSIYKTLNLGPMEVTDVIIQLADRSQTHPVGVVEDVLVKVNELIFPADFYILDMEDDNSINPTPILLGRPFLMTARTKIDCYEGTLTMEFDGEVVKFNIFDAMRYPSDVESICSIEVLDAFDSLVQEIHELEKDDKLEAVLVNHVTNEDLVGEKPLSDGIMEQVHALHVLASLHTKSVNVADLVRSNEKLLPSIVKPPSLELKPLPNHLKYVFLGEFDTLPVIIANNLTDLQEEKLIRILREHKTAIAWSIADIKGISPAMCMHRILLEDDAKPTREPQRRLNPPMMDVVKKEILKLLDAGIIYPISDSKWVSPIQVVPKKSGITVVRNEENELVPTRLQTGWRVCIDYRKLNAVTRKDHFPLPFMDQMLERLAGHSHYCFLDGYTGYNQIVVAPKDQEKTTFTCPFGTFAYRRMPFGLCNAPGTFQRCMVSIFSDLIEHIIEVFMDDFSVYGESFDKCLENLSLVLDRCMETNLVLNWEKCHFMVDHGIVLGHVISAKGIEVDKAKVDLVRCLPYPTSVRDIRAFLGHAGFYRRFIKDFSKIAQPLCRLLQKDVPFEFDEKCKQAFDKLKELLTSAPIIQPPIWDLPFEIMCDASDFAVGAVLGQRIGRESHAIYYASRTLNDA